MPLFALTVGCILGVLFELAPLKTINRKILVLATFASAAGVGLAVPALAYSSSLANLHYFSDLYYDLGALPVFNVLGDNLAFAVALVLIGTFEAALALGFGSAFQVAQYQTRQKQKQANCSENKQDIAAAVNKILNKTENQNGTDIMLLSKEPEPEFTDQCLLEDEQVIMELFLYGKVTQISPVVSACKMEGYGFDGVPQLDWETKRMRQALDSLVRKGMLKAQLVDKVIVCMACGSADVRVKKLCPECMSLRLRKEGLIEHLSCGAVDRQAAFESANGDLVCPKCKGKLQLIGSDYRILPPAYVCLSCNIRSGDPLLVIKCDDCGATAQLDEEPELLLYKYSPNAENPAKNFKQIKPIEAVTNFFKALGYTFVAPAFVSGRSGTQHLFDILLLGKVGWVEPRRGVLTGSVLRRDNGNTVIQVLISSKPVDLEEMTRIYGMINDVDCEALIFVIPSLTENARNYAAAYNMKVSEGKTIEEALSNSKIPKLPKTTLEKT